MARNFGLGRRLAVLPIMLLALIIWARAAYSGAGGHMLWQADHETGDLSQWYFPSKAPDGKHEGGVYNTGIASAVASQDYAHSGSWSAKLVITTPSTPSSGTRLFRWGETHHYKPLYFRVWYYFPQMYKPAQYWNVMQWKSKNADNSINDPFFVLNIGVRPNGAMYLYLADWQGHRSYQQTVADVPVRRWFEVEAFYFCTADHTGRVTFWQDKRLLFDIQNVQTRYSVGDCQWSVNNYSSGITPPTATIYVDDAAISTERIDP